MTRLLLSLGLALTAATVNADVLSVPGDGSQAPQVDRSHLPKRGTTMQRVTARYGEPLGISGPVGDPPITRWVYDGFIVFFEYNQVINAVIPGKPVPIYHKDELRPGR